MALCSILCCIPCWGKMKIHKKASRIGTPIVHPQQRLDNTKFAELSSETHALNDLSDLLLDHTTRPKSHPENPVNLQQEIAEEMGKKRNIPGQTSYNGLSLCNMSTGVHPQRSGLRDVRFCLKSKNWPREKSPPLWGSKFLGGKASDWSRIQNPAF